MNVRRIALFLALLMLTSFCLFACGAPAEQETEKATSAIETRETEPEETTPEATEPEETEPGETGTTEPGQTEPSLIKIDVSGLKFENATVPYDGDVHTISVSGLDTLPGGVTVSYENNQAAMAGTYPATATFTVPEGYAPIPAMEATLTVTAPTVTDAPFTYVDDEKTFLYKLDPELNDVAAAIPETVTRMAENAVMGLPHLQKLYVPATVTEIGEHAIGYLLKNGKYVMDTNIEIWGEAGSAAEAYCEANYLIFHAEDPTLHVSSADDLVLRDGLLLWLDAFDPTNGTVDLTSGKWTSKTDPTKSATLLGANWWKLGENGGVGYTMTRDEWNAHYPETALDIDTALLPANAFTLEAILTATGPTNADGSRYVDSAGRFGLYHADSSAFDFGCLRCLQFGGSSISSNYMTRWFYHEEPWQTHQAMEWIIKDSHALADPATVTMSVVFRSVGARHVIYDLYYNGAKDFTFDNFVSNPPLSYQQFHEIADGNVRLLAGFPGTVFAVRVYDHALTPEEINRNHLADLATYFDLDVSALDGMFDEQLNAVAAAFAGYTFSSDPAEIAAVLKTAATPEYAATVTLAFVDEMGRDVRVPKVLNAVRGDTFHLLMPAVKGYYTRELYLDVTADESKTVTVLYRKIPEAATEDGVAAVMPGVVCWGDSITWGGGMQNETTAKTYGIDLTEFGRNSTSGGYVSVLKNLINSRLTSSLCTVDVANCGVGGETSAVVAARALTEKYKLTIGRDVTVGTAPAEIAITQYSPYGRLGILRQGEGNDGTRSVNEVMIDGVTAAGEVVTVKGNISMMVDGGEVGTTCDYSHLHYWFTRTDGGTDPVTLKAGATIVTYGSYAYDGRWCVIFIGENTGFTSIEELIDQQEQILLASDCHDRYVIISLSSEDAASRREMEEKMAAKWGEHFFSARAVLSRREAYAFLGLSDLQIRDYATDIARGAVPSLFLHDGVHPNALGYTVLGNVLFEKFLSLGYFDPLFDYYDGLQD